MKCINFQQGTRDWIREGGLPGDAAAHAGVCPDCARWLEQETALSASLRALAGDDMSLAPPAGLDPVLRAAFRTRARSSRLVRWSLAAVAAAVVIVAVIAGRSRPPAPIRVAADPVESPFFAISPGAVMEPDSFAPVIRMRLPRRDLRRIGLGWDGPGGDAVSLEVDVLVGRDGVAKAVRLARDTHR